MAFADGRAESPLESLGRARLHEHGIEPPELQVDILDGWRFVGRADFVWRRYRTIGEADGLGKYTAPDVLRAEKLRQERLEQLGYQVVRFTWVDALRRGAATAACFRAAFARAQRG